MNTSNNDQKHIIIIGSASPQIHRVVNVGNARIVTIPVSASVPVRYLAPVIVQPSHQQNQFMSGQQQVAITSVSSPGASRNVRASPVTGVRFQTSPVATMQPLARRPLKPSQSTLCPNCGVLSPDPVKCSRCKKGIRNNDKISKAIEDGIVATRKQIHQGSSKGISSTGFYGKQRESDFSRYVRTAGTCSSSRQKVQKRPLLCGKSQAAEQDCITISSDSEDEASSSSTMSLHTTQAPSNDLQTSSKPSTLENPLGTVIACGEIPRKRAKVNSESPSEGSDTKLVKAISVPQIAEVKSDEDLIKSTLNISINCVRIGQEKLKPKSVMRISQDSITVSAHCVRSGHDVILDVKWLNVAKCMLCSDHQMPCVYVVMNPGSLPQLREQMGMEKGKFPYYDPSGRADEQLFVFYINASFISSSTQCSLETLSRKIELIRRKLKKPSAMFKQISLQDSTRCQNLAAAAEIEREEKMLKPMRELVKLAGQVSVPTSSPEIAPRLRLKIKIQSPVGVVTQNKDVGTTQCNNTVVHDNTVLFSGPRIKLFVFPPTAAKGGISVTNEDEFCLNEGEFLNDVIIEFYLQYVFTRIISPQQRERSHMFSCFFYERLMQKSKKVKDVSPAERRHSQVKKWTRSVDIFSKDFIFVPINEASHWYLAVICFPGLTKETVEISRSNDAKDKLLDIRKKVGSPGVPKCMLYLTQYGQGEEVKVQVENQEKSPSDILRSDKTDASNGPQEAIISKPPGEQSIEVTIVSSPPITSNSSGHGQSTGTSPHCGDDNGRSIKEGAHHPPPGVIRDIAEAHPLPGVARDDSSHVNDPLGVASDELPRDFCPADGASDRFSPKSGMQSTSHKAGSEGQYNCDVTDPKLHASSDANNESGMLEIYITPGTDVVLPKDLMKKCKPSPRKPVVLIRRVESEGSLQIKPETVSHIAPAKSSPLTLPSDRSVPAELSSSVVSDIETTRGTEDPPHGAVPTLPGLKSQCVNEQSMRFHISTSPRELPDCGPLTSSPKRCGKKSAAQLNETPTSPHEGANLTYNEACDSWSNESTKTIVTSVLMDDPENLPAQRDCYVILDSSHGTEKISTVGEDSLLAMPNMDDSEQISRDSSGTFEADLSVNISDVSASNILEDSGQKNRAALSTDLEDCHAHMDCEENTDCISESKISQTGIDDKQSPRRNIKHFRDSSGSLTLVQKNLGNLVLENDVKDCIFEDESTRADYASSTAPLGSSHGVECTNLDSKKSSAIVISGVPIGASNEGQRTCLQKDQMSGQNIATSSNSDPERLPEAPEEKLDKGGGKEKGGGTDAGRKQGVRMFKRPCILIFDSLRGPSRSKIATNLREYLSMEWKTRKESNHGERIFDKDTMKMCSVSVPQQDNFTDCGLFLLHYVEKFFTNPIRNYALPIKDLENWFDPAECRKKRSDIKEVIKDLHKEWRARKVEES